MGGCESFLNRSILLRRGRFLLPKHRISEADIDHFDQYGYLIVRNALDDDTIARLIEASDRLVDSDLKQNRQTAAGGLYDGFRNALTLDDAFIPLIDHPIILPNADGHKVDDLFLTLKEIGFGHDDVVKLEYLSDSKVLSRLPQEKRKLKRNNREDVVTYMNEMANMLEEELV